MRPLNEFLLAAIADACNVERTAVLGSTNLMDIGFDSLSATSLAFLVESSCGVELTEDILVQCYEASTVDDVVSLVTKFVSQTGRHATQPT